jgi:hypothetical protein
MADMTPDVSEVLESAKIQYGSDKVFYMTRRMSGMPLLHRLDKNYVTLDPDIKIKFNELMNSFPDPPSNAQILSSAQAGQNFAPQTKSNGGSWGSIRGIAEKFNVFNKTS